MKRVFVTGGTGFMGAAMVRALRDRGDQPIVLSRDAARARARFGANADGVEFVAGDPNLSGDWQAALKGVDAVVNLVGQSVAGKRWSAHYKQLIHDSRVESTRYLVEGIGALDEADRPAVLVSASGIDYYPFSVDLGAALPVDEDDEVDESVPPGSTFLARVCRNWETEANTAKQLGVRVVCMRTSVVLGKGKGGPLDKMTTPFRFFVGGKIGSGRQWFSWIHLTDAINAYLLAIDQDSVTGPINLVAPQPTRAGEFARALGEALGKPSWMPVPAFALKAAVGEFSDHLLHGRRAVPAALLGHGFEFAFPSITSALADIFG